MDINVIMEMVQQYAVLPAALVCGFVGFLIKHTFTKIPNNFIPLILTILGVVLVFAINSWAFTMDTLVSGVCSGALAVGMHQLIKQLYEKYSGEADAKSE